MPANIRLDLDVAGAQRRDATVVGAARERPCLRSIARPSENPRFGTRPGPKNSLIHVLPGMVGTAYQGAGLDVPKAHRHGLGLKLGELGRSHVALDRQMVERGT